MLQNDSMLKLIKSLKRAHELNYWPSTRMLYAFYYYHDLEDVYKGFGSFFEDVEHTNASFKDNYLVLEICFDSLCDWFGIDDRHDFLDIIEASQG